MSVRDSFANKNWSDYKGETYSSPKFTKGIRLGKIVYAFEPENALYIELLVDTIANESLGFPADELTNYFTRTARARAKTELKNDYECWRSEGRIRLYYASPNSSEKDAAAKNVFKARITAIEECNPGYSFERANFDVQTLVGKDVVCVWSEREYLSSDNEVRVGIKLNTFRSLEAWNNHDITIPPIERLVNQNSRSVSQYQNNGNKYGYQSKATQAPQQPSIPQAQFQNTNQDLDPSMFDVELDDSMLGF